MGCVVRQAEESRSPGGSTGWPGESRFAPAFGGEEHAAGCAVGQAFAVAAGGEDDCSVAWAMNRGENNESRNLEYRNEDQ